MTDQARNMRKLAAASLIVASIAGVAITCAPAPEGPTTITLPLALATTNVGEHTIEEIETERLVCAVAWSKLGRNVAISCVPKIPGLFDEPPR